MQISRTMVISLLICAALFCAGCTRPVSPEHVVSGTGSPVADPAQITLTLSDMPQGFTQAESRTKNPSDMSRLALDLGWQGGHVVRFTSPAQDGNGSYEITQSIATYPERTIPEVIAFSEQQIRSDPNGGYTDFAVQGLGDHARAFYGKTAVQVSQKPAADNSLIVSIDDQQSASAEKTGLAAIIFSKGTTFEVITITGPSPDTAVLLKLGQTAYAKIP